MIGHRRDNYGVLQGPAHMADESAEQMADEKLHGRRQDLRIRTVDSERRQILAEPVRMHS